MVHSSTLWARTGRPAAVPNKPARACAAACAEAAPVHRTEHLRVAERIEPELNQHAPVHDRVLSSSGFGDDIFPNDCLEPCREADYLTVYI